MVTSLSVEQVQALVARIVAESGGAVIATSPTVTSAKFRKRFSWLWFVLLFGVFYLLWWAVSKKDESLTITHLPNGYGATLSFSSSGRRAVKAHNAIVRAISAQDASRPAASA